MKSAAIPQDTRSNLLVAAGYLFIGVLGFLDFHTGYEISFAFFYLIPVVLTTWYGNRALGLVASIVSAVVWQLANQLAGNTFSSAWIPYWNAVTRLGFFSVVAFLLTRLRLSLQLEQSLSRTDYLTGAANSRSFYERAEVEMERSRRYKHTLTLAYIDLDNFKQVNDEFGHAGGDHALRTVAGAILYMIRNTDMVARLGGDEFAILMPETSSESAKLVLQRLHDVLMKRMEENHWPITFSIGVVTCNTLPDRLDDLIHTADDLMYAVKTRGKNGLDYRVL